MPEPSHTYLIALGSNMRHPRHGPPREVVRQAVAALAEAGIMRIVLSPIVASRPVGPSLRSYANAVLLCRADLAPPAMLERLLAVEAQFGRRRRGQRWRARTLDLDIVLWSGGRWHSPTLAIPHPLFRERLFVLAPAAAIAGSWRDPASGLTLRQLAARLARRG